MNKRYAEDEAWREQAKSNAITRYKTATVTCACGKPKRLKAKLCWDCWSTPTDTCTRCSKPRNEDFNANVCRECVLKRQAAYRSTTEARHKMGVLQRKRNLQKQYGMTQMEWKLLLAQQDGKCAVCRTANWGHKGPVVDHDHKLGNTRAAVRGLLCLGCNWALGKLGDDAAGLRRALRYLEAFESMP